MTINSVEVALYPAVDLPGRGRQAVALDSNQDLRLSQGDIYLVRVDQQTGDLQNLDGTALAQLDTDSNGILRSSELTDDLFFGNSEVSVGHPKQVVNVNRWVEQQGVTYTVDLANNRWKAEWQPPEPPSPGDAFRQNVGPCLEAGVILGTLAGFPLMALGAGFWSLLAPAVGAGAGLAAAALLPGQTQPVEPFPAFYSLS